MKIETSYVSTPALWQAIDADSYDDATDAKAQCVGYGKTEREAVNDLVEQIRDDAYAQGQRDGQEQESDIHIRLALDECARHLEMLRDAGSADWVPNSTNHAIERARKALGEHKEPA